MNRQNLKHLTLVATASLTLVLLVTAYSRTTQTKIGNEQGLNTAVDPQPGNTVKTPEGVSMSGKSVRLQTGYQFVPQGKGTVAVAKKNNGTITAKLTCGCSYDARKQGSCELELIKDVANCKSAGCDGCLFTATILSRGTVQRY
jgi:hypothetical protein